ncbi:MAG: hypothetical protein AAF790_02535 [Planctomycetota bacterium]
MANEMRWRYGDTNPVMLPVDSATVIEIGDLIFFDTDDAKPASLQVDQGTEAINQEVFHDKFAGVAMQCSAAGETAAIRVATTGVFEFGCPAATYQVGDMLGPAENSGGTALEDQVLDKVLSPSSAVGRCAKQVNPAGTRVHVDVVSSLLKGGAQAVA